jgi:2-desacetyl-2-hydroxyethyl bacteriochlorophyllide A dehydrogenase
MKRRSVVFNAPHEAVLVQETLNDSLSERQVMVETIASAISPGTEMLVYRGEAPDNLTVDETLAALPGAFSFPIKYGYSAVGRVVKIGGSVDSSWQDRVVFAFNPHETAFTASVDDLVPLPPDIQPEEAVFLPNMETAVNFVMDGRPLIGEQIVIFGQGIVGLLTAALLVNVPLAKVFTVDRYPRRRDLSCRLNVEASFDPDSATFAADLAEQLGRRGDDLTFELSGAPAALDQAIRATGFGGRVVIGSWYGQKSVTLALGGEFHRSRITLISSQVSTLQPELTGRWDKARRFELVWEAIRRIRPAQFITHRIPVEEASSAYQLYDQHPDDALQIILTYRSSS